MENIGSEVIFYIIAAVMGIFSVMAVTTKHLLRSATYLLFVLFGTAALYFQLEYEFLGAVQVALCQSCPAAFPSVAPHAVQVLGAVQVASW